MDQGIYKPSPTAAAIGVGNGIVPNCEIMGQEEIRTFDLEETMEFGFGQDSTSFQQLGLPPPIGTMEWELEQEQGILAPGPGQETFTPADPIQDILVLDSELGQQQQVSTLEPLNMETFTLEPPGQEIVNLEQVQEIITLELGQKLVPLEQGQEIVATFELEQGIMEEVVARDTDEGPTTQTNQKQQESSKLALNISKELRKYPKTIKEIQIKPIQLTPRKTNNNRNNVPESAKDDKYYAARAKNAAATKRTRQIKKLQMEEMMQRHDFLEKACAELQLKIQQLKQGQINTTTKEQQ